MPLLIEVLPVRVQGAEAVGEIVNALNFLHELPDVEVAILARGGGSVEDMQPFNTEALARAIAKAPIPVISAVGHETDFTISDFVADLRAPTPSAAIDMLLPDRDEVLHKLDNLKRRLQGNLQSRVLLAQARLNRLQLGLPKTMLLEQQQCISYLEYKLKHSIIRKMQAKVQTLSLLKLQLALQDPQIKLNERRYSLEKAEQKLKSLLQAKLKASQDRTLILQQKLLLLGPTATLERGYAMVRDPEINEVLSDSGRFMVGQRLEIIVKNGHVWCAVEKVVKNG